MAKQRGYPDRRGMGAQSDFISETFVPSEQHQERRLATAYRLIATGISPQSVAEMLSVPIDILLDKTPDQRSA